MEGNYLQVFAERTPLRSAVKSTYIQKCVSFGSTKKGLSFDDTLAPNMTIQHSADEPIMSPIANGNTTNFAMSGIFDLECSKQAFQDSSFQNKGHLTVNASNESGMNTTTLINIDDPGNCYTDSLFQEFLDFFLSYCGEHEAFNLLLNYEELCCIQIEQLRNILKRIASAETKFYKTSNMLRYLEEERNTWRLLRCLFQDRLGTDSVDEGEMLMDTLGKRISDKQIVENLYLKDSVIRQSQIIVDWLEKNAADDFHSTYVDKLEYFTDHCVSWEHTLHELTTNFIDIKQHSKGFFSPEMDPDAPIRQKKNVLHEADKDNESRLLKHMFVCLRAGNLDNAQRLAERFGDAWLAAALEGWRLYHDPNYDNVSCGDGQVLLPIEGNKYRDIWKTACWEMSREPAIPLCEQAIYGSLSGNLKAILPVCTNWADHLWAYMRTLVDKRIEQEIRSCTQQERTLEDLPLEYWDKILDLEQVFQELQASESDIVKTESRSPLHVIQKYIILDDIDGLIEEMHSWLNDTCGREPHILRCMVHIILFLRVVGHSTKEELCVPVLEAYVQELIKAHKVSLVAPYTATLSKHLQIIWYAKFLEGITDNAERQQCLQLAEESGLDVPMITKTVVENIRKKEVEADDFSTDLSAVTTEEDQQKISAIDWLIFDPSQRAEALMQANALLRLFVARKKIEAAKQLFSKIPADSVAVMIQLSKMKGLTELSSDDDNATREYLCFKAYLESIEAFNDWFRHFTHAKPQLTPAPTGENVRFKDKVAYEHEVKQYEVDLERWNRVLTSLGSTAADSLYNVLLFVNGGWMVDQGSSSTVDESRQKQMLLLRKLCIPHITRLLQTVLFNEDRLKEAIQLSDIITSEQYQLYTEFTTEDLQNFLSTTLQSCRSLLDRNFDPVGYPFQ